MPSTGLRPEPVLPVTPLTNSVGSTQPEREQRHAGQQDRRREAARMRDVRRRRGLQVFRHRAGELREPLRRAVRMFVDGFVGGGGGVTEVRRDVDEARLGARGLRGLEQACRSARPRRRAARRRTRPTSARCAISAAISACDLNVVSPSSAREMRERFARELAGRAVGHHARELEARVAEDQAQQFAGDVAGAAEHDGRESCRHGRSSSRVTRSPRARARAPASGRRN